MAVKDRLRPERQTLDRFVRSLDAVAAQDQCVGVAVSGGPDSVALLLLAAAARPGQVKAATVDHALRVESREEAEDVAALCRTLGVPHDILTLDWAEKPATAIPERARIARYLALVGWAREAGVDVIATAHHVDDQAETLLMRLARGTGLRGLAAMRPLRMISGGAAIARPLLGWKREELSAICAAAGVHPAQDPTNRDRQFERVRVRDMLAATEWLDPLRLARSASYLTQAESALNWAAKQEWTKRVSERDHVVTFDPADLPNELKRRIVGTIILQLKTEARDLDLRGAELDRLLAMLSNGRKATLRGVLCGGGERWRFAVAPARKPTRD